MAKLEVRPIEAVERLRAERGGVWRVVRLVHRRRPFLTAVLVIGAIAVALLGPTPPASLLDPSLSARFLLPWALMLFGVAVRVWGSGNLHKNQEITRSGIYTMVRHPLYLGSLSIFLAFFLSLGNPWVGLAFWLVLAFGVYYPTMLSEEEYLLLRFPGLAADYRPPPRLLPDLRACPPRCAATSSPCARRAATWGSAASGSSSPCRSSSNCCAGSRASCTEPAACSAPPRSVDLSAMSRIAYLDGRGLRAALIAACDYVQTHRAELNRINVFPVPDGDTGTNLALTAASIAEHLRRNRDRAAGRVALAAAEAGVLGARGNCGMILSHFLLGFAESIEDVARLTVASFGTALRAAVEHVYAALERPVEGTMLTVMREVADEAEASDSQDFLVLMHQLVARARSALERTPDLLPVLRSAGVVDAGAKGFVHLLEGVAAYIAGDPLVAAKAGAELQGEPLAAARAAYPTEVRALPLLHGGAGAGHGAARRAEVRERLHARGDSLVVIRAGSLLKVHIHTDEPDAVLAYLRGLGELTAHKAEDMQLQHAAVARAAGEGHVHLARRPLVVVTDSACDLPEEVVRAHGIYRVPLNLVFESETLRDGGEIGPSAVPAPHPPGRPPHHLPARTRRLPRQLPPRR